MEIKGKAARKAAIAAEQGRRGSNGTATIEPEVITTQGTEENADLGAAIAGLLNPTPQIVEIEGKGKAKESEETAPVTAEPVETPMPSGYEIFDPTAIETALESTQKVVKELVVDMQAVQNQLNNIKGTVSEVVNATAELAVSGAFSKHNKEFASIWDPRLAQVLGAVQGLRTEMQGALGDLSEIRMFLPVLRQLGTIQSDMANMTKLHAEVTAARDQILQAVKNLKQPQPMATASTPQKPSGLFGN